MAGRSHHKHPARPGLLRRRFPFLFFPLRPYRDTVDLTGPNGELDKHVEKARYSLRLQRYWWAASKLSEEASHAEDRLVVVDLGCERGWLKRFTDPDLDIRWIGLDGNTDHPSLAASGYDEVITCNFSQQLPLPEACADAVVSLHVFEHLKDAETALSEVARILKPGGVFLAGTPVAPGPIAAVRTRWLVRRDQAGRNRHWGHVRKFSPSAWCRVCESVGLGVEFITGSHLVRRTGARVENSRLWTRLNQLWGGAFPSLGSEVYLSARKPADGRTARAGVIEKLWLKADWAAPVAAVIAFGLFVQFSLSHATADSLYNEIAAHQDGNNTYIWAVSSRPISKQTARGVEPSGFDGELDSEFDEFRERGRDLYLIVHEKEAAEYLRSPVADRLRVSAEWTEDEQRYLVIAAGTEGTALEEHLRTRRN